MLITLTGLSAPAPVEAAPPKPAARPIEIVLQRRQALQLLILALAIMLLTSATSYLVGKYAAEKAQPAERAVPVSKPAPAPVSSTPAPPDPPPALVRGATYLQVAAVDPGVGEVFVEVLKRKYFSALLAAGPDPSTVRVLVGPVRDDDAFRDLRDDLLHAGFLSFPRKFLAGADSRVVIGASAGWSAGQ